MLLLVKFLTFLITPFGSGAALLLLSGLSALLGWRRLAHAALWLGIGWMWLWATPVVSEWARGQVEDAVPVIALKDLPLADAIVVLGGAVAPAAPPKREFPELTSAADRVWHAARLYRAGKAPRVILLGGNAHASSRLGPEAEAMRVFLRDLGVPEQAIRIETTSRTTRENAHNSAQLFEQEKVRKILLVTSAIHMRRALANFSGLGIEVIPAATDIEVVSESRALLPYLPDLAQLDASGRAFKEWVGHAAWRWLR